MHEKTILHEDIFAQLKFFLNFSINLNYLFYTFINLNFLYFLFLLSLLPLTLTLDW